jgi:hypothetical protein
MEDRLATAVGRRDDAGDLFEVLAQARQLIDHAISSRGNQAVSSVSSKSVRREVIRDLVANAQQDIRCVVSSEQFLEELVETFADLDFASIGKHVHVAAVCDVSTADSPVIANLVRSYDLSVRVGHRDLPDMLLIDRGQAFTRLSPADADSLFIWNSEMVKLLHAFFGEAWRSAFDHRTYQRMSRIHRCAQTRQIIDLLASGNKDEVAARSMGMSVRTYRRYIAELMRDLDAQSRFQVGAWVAQMGLINSLKDRM